jgi:hypothetical protein
VTEWLQRSVTSAKVLFYQNVRLTIENIGSERSGVWLIFDLLVCKLCAQIVIVVGRTIKELFLERNIL